MTPGTFQVTQNGCQPQTGVERVPLSEQNKATVERIGKGSRGIVQGGVVLVRAAPPPTDDVPSVEDEPAMIDLATIRPIVGSTVMATKPSFSWPAIPEAERYTLNLYFLGDLVWSATSEQPALDYAGETPLKC